MIFQLLCILFSSSLMASSTKAIFVTEECKPTEGLIELLKLDGLYDKKDSLNDIVEKTQKKWIAVNQGKNNIERIDLKDSPEMQKIRPQVEEIAWKMGLFSAQRPTRTAYDYAVCPGAFLDGVRFRLNELVHLWKQGVRFDALYFLAGERPLRKNPGDMDSIDRLCNEKASPFAFKANWKIPDNVSYESEYDMVQLVWDQIALPEDMAKSLDGKVFFVNASRGDFSRPSTRDNYKAWLEQCKPKPGCCLIATSHPLYWTYQKLAAENVLGKEFRLDVATPEMAKEELKRKKESIVSLVHDTVAKCLFEIQAQTIRDEIANSNQLS